jgi:hypothetical protein
VVLKVGNIAGNIGEALADAFCHLRRIVDVLVGGLGPTLGQVDENVVSSSLMRPLPTAE